MIAVLYYANGEAYTITNLVTLIQWDGDTTTVSRNATISLINTLDGQNQAINIKVGKEIRFFYDGEEKFRGIIFETDINSDGAFIFTAHDYNYYLTKNTDSMKFEEQTAGAIVKKICTQYKIDFGHIEDTEYVIPKLILRNRTLYDMMTIALTETKKKTGKVFLLGNEKGKLVLRENKKQVVRLVIAEGKNLLSANYSESIEELRNSVRLTGKSGEDSVGVTVEDVDSVKKFGRMRVKEHESEMPDDQLKPIATALLQELNKVARESNVEAIGFPTVIAGKMVQVSEKMTGIEGAFYVITDSHTFNPSGLHTMNLRVSKELEVAEIEYEPPAENEEGSSLSSDTFSFNLDMTVGLSYENFEATAYNPSLGGINGSGDYKTTASGTTFAALRSVAIDPSVIPYGSVILVHVPTMQEYSGIYLAEDTGGAIKGNRLDMGIEANKAKQFGRRQVRVAILEKGSGKSDARTKASNWSNIQNGWERTLADQSSANSGGGGEKADKVMSLARSYVGKLTYDFGGKNIPSGRGDCSGFTYHVYKSAIGLDIGHGTSVQLTKGTKISENDAKAGDVVFFQGTYRKGVSHVGIVTTKGKCISLASSGCVEHSYTDGYWGKHYMQIRRVL